MFTKEERSKFNYWFAHWCAFQMTALNLHHWKFKYLFHDIEKPWLRLFMSYKKVQKWHRNHHRHHFEWLERKLAALDKKGGGYLNPIIDRFDWEALMIDWECSRFTKLASPRNARDELFAFFDHNNIEEKYPYIYLHKDLILQKSFEALKKLGL